MAVAVQAGDDRAWRACLPPQPAGGPYTLRISVPGYDIYLADVLFGEVWLASGQSNMEMTVLAAYNNTAECQAATAFTRIRVMTVAKREEDNELDDLPDDGLSQAWTPASAPGAICGTAGGPAVLHACAPLPQAPLRHASRVAPCTSALVRTHTM